MRLIFIEGVPGVGKSTAVVKLCEILANRGYSARSYLEADIANPIDLYWCAYLTKTGYEKIITENKAFAGEIAANSIIAENYALTRYRDLNRQYYSPELREYFKAREICYKAQNPVPPETFTQIFSDRWKSFLSDNSAGRDYNIFDGAFMAHQINDMLRSYNPPDGLIMRHLETVFNIIKTFNPVVFYLESNDIWERIRAANISRGQSVPPQEQTAFWKNRKRVDLLVPDNLPIEFHRFDISNGNWDSAIEKMAEKLNPRN